MKNTWKSATDAPEVSANGDEVTTAELIKLFEKTLSSAWHLVGMYSYEGYNEREDFMDILPDHEKAFDLVTPNGDDGEWYYQTGFVFKVRPECHDEILCVIDYLEDMGRYPLSDSGGDDHFVSFSMTEYSDKEYYILEYWFDDSTR